MEQRLTFRLTTYWNKIKGDRELPHIEQFNQQSVSDLWENCMIVEILEEAPLTYNINYLGKNLHGFIGNNQTSIRFNINSTPNKPLQKLIKKLADNITLKKVEAINEEGTFTNHQNKVIRYRSCLLPFNKGKEKITNCIIGISWQVI